VSGFVLLFGALSACGGTEHESEDGIETVQSALVVADKLFTDGSGEVKILVRTCDYPATATTGPRCTFCALDQGWVMVGGGAEIEGSPSSARLRSSFPYPNSLIPPIKSPDNIETCTGNTADNDPNDFFTAWMARSDGASAHRLRGYVIGLQITGMGASALAQYRNISDSTTMFLTQPSHERPGGSALIVGGGADEVGGQNCFLTESAPNESNNSWRGSAYCSSPGALKVYGITLDTCLPVPGWDSCMYWRTRSAVTGPTTGYGTASLVTPYPWVTTSIGGKGVVNFASSRFLADLIPVTGGNQGFSVSTKDQGVTVNGTTTGYSVNVFGGRWGTWLFNSIRFNTPGTALSRPSGTAPVALQQSTANPDAAPRRWHLEAFGSAGQYRLRNGNPQGGTECAYRQGTTVLVGPCGSGNEFRWTISGDPVTTLKLRNVAAGQCLDNNNAGYATSNLVLKSCVVGYSDVQSVFLDKYSWPP
jgi:hypothetical protein